MTKPITTVAALQLVESGQIEPEAPAGSYVPEIDDLPVLPDIVWLKLQALRDGAELVSSRLKLAAGSDRCGYRNASFIRRMSGHVRGLCIVRGAFRSAGRTRRPAQITRPV